MHVISLGSDKFSALLFFKDNIKKLKKPVKRIRILINENNSQIIYLAFFSDRFTERGETF
ncbi:dTDP-glucose 4,6-dehydratase RfbB [Neochlamydia sp. S13]|nr:dTDP-glucose 4,6-dehydratase RfbB [Neochlamydia sp. S13]